MRAEACSARVGRLCAETEARLPPGPAREEVAIARDGLAEPLRVAVAGRVSSGKSTLVNALLNQDIAPTAVGECTRVVTWFRYGIPAEARLVLAGGGRAQLPLEPGPRLPATLGVAPGDLDRVEVQLANDALTRLSVIDTPGLASSNDEFSASARRALGPGEADAVSRRSEAGAGHADALIYVLTGIAQEDEVHTLEEFRRRLGGMRASAINTVAVLNKADMLGEDEDDEDALDRARSVAEALGQRLAGLSATVIPTVGLIAETVEAGRITEADARALTRLAALDASTKRRLCADQRWFATADAEVPADVRGRLLGLLGLYGVRRCIEWNEERPLSAHELSSRLIELSGLAQLQKVVADLFERRADVLKAANALAHLERLLSRPDVLADPERERLGHEIERARLEPEMQALATAWALAEVDAKSIELPEHLAEDLRRVALGAGVADQLGAPPGAPVETLRDIAARRSGEWRAFANSGCRVEQQRIAGVMYDQHAALWHLAGQDGTA